MKNALTLEAFAEPNKDEGQDVPRLVPTDIFAVSEGMPSEDLAALTEYLSIFAPPKNSAGKFACINCQSEMDGFMHAMGMGAAYIWDITHGEAHCSKCRWPARGMHYVKRPDGVEVVTVSNLFLPYHPSMVKLRDSARLREATP